MAVRSGRLPDARCSELALGFSRRSLWLSLCLWKFGGYGGAPAHAYRGVISRRPPGARRTTAARVSGDRAFGVPAKAVLAGPTSTDGLRPHAGLRPAHRRRSLVSLPERTRAPFHNPARDHLPFKQERITASWGSAGTARVVGESSLSRDALDFGRRGRGVVGDHRRAVGFRERGLAGAVEKPTILRTCLATTVQRYLVPVGDETGLSLDLQCQVLH
jgi:hypothetical protein